MILSRVHKFVFIKGRKVAGTSVEMALAAICGPDDIVTPLFPVEERERLRTGAACRNYADKPLWEQGYLALLTKATPAQAVSLSPPAPVFFEHMPLSLVEQRYPHSLDGFRIVCVERSPYAKVISLLNMNESGFLTYRAGGALRQIMSDPRASFDRQRADIGGAKNIGMYRNRAGALHVEVLRYERLQEDFDAFVRALDCQPRPLPHAKKGLMSNRLDPRDVFRRDQLDLINAVYEEEFEVFGYSRL